jgi:hypothetical protein
LAATGVAKKHALHTSMCDHSATDHGTSLLDGPGVVSATLISAGKDRPAGSPRIAFRRPKMTSSVMTVSESATRAHQALVTCAGH